MKRLIAGAPVAVLAALVAFGIASAHATLDHCTPEVGSAVVAAPAQIICVFSEEIDTKQSTMSAWDQNGDEVDKNDAHVDLNDPDHRTLIVSLDLAKVKDGLYTVKWHSVTPDDNGISEGSWQFVIGSASATPFPPTEIVQGETSPVTIPTESSGSNAVTPAVSPTSTIPAASATPEATATATAPTTAPTTGAHELSGWILFAILGLTFVFGGTLIWVRR